MSSIQIRAGAGRHYWLNESGERTNLSIINRGGHWRRAVCLGRRGNDTLLTLGL